MPARSTLRTVAKKAAAPAPSSLHRILGDFASQRVLVVGDLVADHYVYGHTERVSREAPVLVVRHERSEVKLGGAANAAANLASLGARVRAVGLLGRDPMGESLTQAFKAQGIRLDAITSPKVVTETKTRILAGGLSTTRQQVVRLDQGALEPPPPSLRERLARTVARVAAQVDAVLVSDYGAGVVGDEVRAVLRELVARGVTVCVDSRYGLMKFAGFPVLKPNEPELEALVGRPLRTDREVTEAGRQAKRMLRCNALVVTRGHKGMRVFTPRRVEDVPVHGAAEAVDVTGAGDTVIAALTLSLSAGASVVDAARVANVAGALVVQKMGTATLTLGELQEALPR
ncbi:MAG TPA: bifunctional ADP-heptose synthase [Myxococcaceae bacterium]|nr:bifunctional ADP-heptose synthase [Myxococcaceae bacterium]